MNTPPVMRVMGLFLLVSAMDSARYATDLPGWVDIVLAVVVAGVAVFTAVWVHERARRGEHRS